MDSQQNQQASSSQNSLDAQQTSSNNTSPQARSNKLPLIVIWTLVLLLLFIVGYLFFAEKPQSSDIGSNKMAVASPTIIVTDVPVEPTSVIQISETVNAVDGESVKRIKYKLSANWQANLYKSTLQLKPKSGEGYLYVTVYDYNSTVGKREFYCQITDSCSSLTKYKEIPIGNISGYEPGPIDSDGGGGEYFGVKGDKFYLITIYNSSLQKELDESYEDIISSLIF